MHFDHGRVPVEYQRYLGRKLCFIAALALLLALALLFAISLGAARIPVLSVAQTLLGMETSRQVESIVWHIRLPQALARRAAARADVAAAG